MARIQGGKMTLTLTNFEASATRVSLIHGIHFYTHMLELDKIGETSDYWSKRILDLHKIYVKVGGLLSLSEILKSDPKLQIA